MTRKSRIWGASALLLAGWLFLAYRIPDWLSLTGTPRWVAMGALALIGTFLAVFVAAFLTKRPPPPPAPTDPLSQEMEAALVQAERKLIASKTVGSRPLQRVPALFVLGPQQHRKTSTVIKSGAQAELLAGEVMQGLNVVSTRALNIWLSRPMLILEAGTEVLQDAARRARLWHRLQPARLADAVARGEQAPRAALVCVNLATFRTTGQGVALARSLRPILSELAGAYGVQLPVYVAFTAADELPGFREYARHLTADEVQEVVGATLPLPEATTASTYADVARARVKGAFSTMVYALATRRHAVLGRLEGATDRGAAYQFPRDLGKLEPEIAEFLVELVRPSELQLNPFVRGFYLSGVRDVMVSTGSAVAADLLAPRNEPEGGATALLSALPRPDAKLSAPSQSGATTRREAQWVFVQRLFSGVLQNDPVGFAVTRGGTRISYFRRIALASALGATVLLLLAITVAFGRNMGLARRAMERQQAAATLSAAPTTASPTVDQLLVLDSLGAVLDEVSDHVQTGAPLFNRWGMSRSGRLYPAVRASYFKHFGTLLYAQTQGNMTARLRGVQPAALGGRDYEATYRRLKAHLITTRFNDSSTVEFLAPALMSDWPGPATDTVLAPLVQRQFERYARELALARIYDGAADEAGVAAAREGINRSSGDQPIYQAMISDASSQTPEFRFANLQTASVRTLSVPHVVPGAFTAKGWDIVHAGLGNIDRYLKREEWVVGPGAPAPTMSRDSLVRILRTRYDAEYTEQWRQLVGRAGVVGFGNLADAAARLSALGSTGSEFLLLFASVNENIPDDSQRVVRSFTTIGTLGAAKLGPVLTTAAMEPYRAALSTLAGKTQLAAGVTDVGAGKQFFSDGLLATTEVNTQVQGLSAALDRNELQTLGLVRLLQQPSQLAERVLRDALNRADRAAGAAGAEQGGADYCAMLSPLTSKRPFVSGGEDVTVQELAQVFGPNSPLRSLSQAVREVGTPEAVQFVGRLSRFSEALYGAGSNEAQLRFEIAPDGSEQERSITLQFGGRSKVYPPGQTDYLAVTWNLAVDRNLAFGYSGQNLQSIDGPWAVKTLFQSATGWTPEGNGVYRFRDQYGIAFRARMSAAVAGVMRGEVFAGGVRCPAKWAR